MPSGVPSRKNREKGPASIPSTTSRTEEFLRTIIPFRARFGTNPFVDVLHIDRYLFVFRDDVGNIGLRYKSTLLEIFLDESAGLPLIAHLAKPPVVEVM